MRKNKLQQYFPIIKTEMEILEEIKKVPHLYFVFSRWTKEQQQAFLQQCTGVKGFKLLYDAFFKEIMDPETVPERLNEFLSLILKCKVKILRSLPTDGPRLDDETSLVLMDMVVQLEDGSIVNMEIQRIGYRFPGQRSACYSADLLLRQYRRIRSEKGKAFTYRDIMPVYTIVLFEQSPAMYKKFPGTYVHYAQQKTNTGLEVELLQKYVFIPLDIFKEVLHNKGISNRLELWLAFLCEDDPEYIIQISQRHPEFEAMYKEVYGMCKNIEDVMNGFSEELRLLDRNTVQFMIDEMQEEIDQKKEELNQINVWLSQKDEELSQKDEELSQKDEELSQKDEELVQKDEELNQKDEQLSQKDEELVRMNRDKRLTGLLVKALAEDNRMEDLIRISSDEVYKGQLIQEYCLESMELSKDDSNETAVCQSKGR